MLTDLISGEARIYCLGGYIPGHGRRGIAGAILGALGAMPPVGSSRGKALAGRSGNEASAEDEKAS